MRKVECLADIVYNKALEKSRCPLPYIELRARLPEELERFENDETRLILKAVGDEQKTYAQAANDLGLKKSHVERVYQRAVFTLSELLSYPPESPLLLTIYNAARANGIVGEGGKPLSSEEVNYSRA